MARMKFFNTLSKVLLLLTFMILSGAVVTEEARKCYWCGPLADQVHRSRRAPACDAAENHVIGCEPDLPYCAIVATSPPYVESRLCVKLYQDECYPLYCNSTKSWKMTCPCQGDLCNGPNEDREIEAFEVLGKLVAKTRTTRIKKRTQINTVKFLPSGVDKTVIITNISASESNELNNDIDNNEVTQIIISEEPMYNTQELKEENIMSTDITSQIYEKEEQSTETTEEAMKETTNQIFTTSKGLVTKSLEITQPENLMDNILKPSEQLPTAEALQQNTSPKTSSEKTTVQTTQNYETTTYQTTDKENEITTEKAIKPKNDCNKLYSNLELMGLNIFLAYISKYM